MSEVEIILICLTVLIYAIWQILWLRDKVISRFAPRGPRYWCGRTLKAEQLKPIIREVQVSNLAKRPPNFGVSSRQMKVACARQALGRLAYFKARSNEQDDSAEGKEPPQRSS
jgi:hypothetical protein